MQKRIVSRKASGLFSDLSNQLTSSQEIFSDLITAPFSLSAFEDQMQLKDQHFSDSKRSVLAATLRQQYSSFKNTELVLENISKLENSNAYTITTGHQLNIFTGPIYFIYKILHVIRLAEILKEKYPNKEFVPVFWMASEDHDFEEINHTNLFNKKISWNEPQGGAVGDYDLNNWDLLKDEVFNLFQNHLHSEVWETLKAYNGKNLSEATKSLVHHLFGDQGLVIVEPNCVELKQEFAAIMAQEVETSFAEKAVLKSNQVLEELGFKPQVFARPINLFYLQKGSRERLILEKDQIKIANYGTFSKAEILEQIKQNPELFSPNVVLRPVYQECILPNLAYVGGGGEMAYWLQFKGVFDACNIPFPLIQVRNSLQLIDANTQRKMDLLGIALDEVFQDLEVLKKGYVLKHSQEVLDFTALEKATADLTKQVSTQISHVNVHLNQFEEAEIKRLNKQIQTIQNKLIKHQKRKFEDAMRQMEDVHENLFPKNGVQERNQNFLNFCGNGEVFSFLEKIKMAIDPLENELIILNLD